MNIKKKEEDKYRQRYGPFPSGGGSLSGSSGGGGGGVPTSPGTPVDSVQFNHPLGTFAGSANFTYRDDGATVVGTNLAIYSTSINPSIGIWNNQNGGAAADFYAYAGTGATPPFARLRATASGADNTDLLRLASSANLMSGSTNSGGLAIISDHTTAPIIIATGGHALANEVVRIVNAGVTITGNLTVTGNIYGGPKAIVIAIGDETTAITAGTGKIAFRMPFKFTLTGVRASLTTAQSSGNIFTVDINESGTSVLSTKLTIDNTEKTSTTAVTPAVISDSSLADDAEISIDVDQVGASADAAGLKVYLIGKTAA